MALQTQTPRNFQARAAFASCDAICAANRDRLVASRESGCAVQAADLSQLLVRAREGDRAAIDALFSAVYAELKRIAGRQVRLLAGHTIAPDFVEFAVRIQNDPVPRDQAAGFSGLIDDADTVAEDVGRGIILSRGLIGQEAGRDNHPNTLGEGV